MSRMMLVADNTLSEKSTVAADAALNLLHDSHASPGMLKDYAMSIRSGLLTCRLDEEVERWRTHYSSPFECVLCCQKFGQGFSVSALFHSCDHGASSCSSCLDRYINDICLKDTMGHFTEHGVRCWNSGCSCSLPLSVVTARAKVSEERIKAHILAAAVRADRHSRWGANGSCDAIVRGETEVGTCTKCLTVTCMNCGLPSHKGKSCEAAAEAEVYSLYCAVTGKCAVSAG